nr:hypothetical protein [Tanacetum cinerariifolium]GFA77474.1 hypothetical protein [Tanacetum cinerariifolium]
MTSITAQQTKLDLELVPKENQLDIVKCNERIPRQLKPKKKHFKLLWMHLHSLLAILHLSLLLMSLKELDHTGVVNSLNDVVINQMHQPWRTFAALINRILAGKTYAVTIRYF